MTAAASIQRLPWWAAIPAAALGGLLFDLAAPGVAAWPLVFPAILLMLAAWWQQRAGVAVLAGFAAGGVFWFSHLSWLTLYLGPVPWLGLAGLMTLWFGLQGLASSVATRGLASLALRRPSIAGVPLAALQALSFAGIWVLREGGQGTIPYGGFPWGRVAHVFAESPLGAVVSWVGFAGLSGAIVLVCAVVVTLPPQLSRHTAGETARRQPGAFGKRALSLAAVAGCAAIVTAALGAVPPAELEQTGTLRVGAVQGNSKSGIFDNRESGDVYADHVRGTKDMLEDLESRGESVDVIVWPENSAEFALTDNPLRGRELALLSQRAGAPIVAGSVLANDDGTYSNSSLVWGPTGEQQGPESRYDKRFPVPFAEYMPNRDFFHALAPELVDLVQLEYVKGQTAAALGIDLPNSELRAGLAICFDIIFDDQAERMVAEGAEIILAPTNNADFGRTDESVQQLQIARLRAIETGRTLVNISTVGTSRIVAPDGSDLASLDAFTRGAMVAEVPLVSGATPALNYGSAIAALWMAIGAAAFFGGAALLLRQPAARAE